MDSHLQASSDACNDDPDLRHGLVVNISLMKFEVVGLSFEVAIGDVNYGRVD